jgi:hypothetical protein
MEITSTKLTAASWILNWLVIIAAKAKRYIIREEASLNRLSPSAMLTSDFGTFTCLIISVEAMASGGEIIPPSKNPRAKLKPGISQLDTKATTVEVSTTIGKAKLIITRRHFQNSFHDTCQAAA